MTVPEHITALLMAHRVILVGALLLLAVLLFFCLIRAMKGPRVADRIIAVNMMGTMVMVIIAIMAFLLDEGYLVDICLIYAMISFLAVIVLSKVYMGVYHQRKLQEENQTKAASEEPVKPKEISELIAKAEEIGMKRKTENTKDSNHVKGKLKSDMHKRAAQRIENAYKQEKGDTNA